jgi:hypothetical protein
MNMGLGGNPYGPAGTGEMEYVFYMKEKNWMPFFHITIFCHTFNERNYTENV